MDRLWIANAPAGVVSTGPAVIEDVAVMVEYRDEMGWRVEGPFVEVGLCPPTCVECPSCGAEVDTHTARPL